MIKAKESLPDRVNKGKEAVLERLTALDGSQLHAVLATSMDDQPYTSMIAYALTPDKMGIVFVTPGKTLKYRNMIRNCRVSLLIDTRSNTDRDYMDAESLTVLGEALPVRKGKRWSELAGVLTGKHPPLDGVIHSPESRLILVKISRLIHVTRFQTVSEWIPG
ncbi:MAG TPA: pyridoxamine 5'-phosphate oxidase family protein [Syntrophales bacterium]|nr:pyridoxamine 5'-phosphate oxidase family protein [Syntrophales bacterium]